MSSYSDLSVRMKFYEEQETEFFDNSLPLVIRVDGRGFSNFSKSFKKPYDEDLSKLMKNTAIFLLKETGADMVYHQSDEISLLFNAIENPISERIFNGNKSKIISITAGLASSYFMKKYMLLLLSRGENLEENNKTPHFDSRGFALPSTTEVGNYFLWRQQDAKRNSISMLARYTLGHKATQNMSGNDMLELLEDANINYEAMHFNFKYGSFFKKKTITRCIDDNEFTRTYVAEYNVPKVTYELNLGDDYTIH